MADNTKTDVPKATYRRLGNSGLRVSVPILGAMHVGDKRWLSWSLDGDEATDLLKAAYDRGVTSWDTANIYGNGASEEIIAQALKKHKIPRHKVVIMSKCFGIVRESNDAETLALKNIEDRQEYINQGGLSRGAIYNQVNASLKRLDTDYIDVLQIHRFDPKVPIEETMKALHDLVESGKVRYIGASSMWAYQFAMMQFCAEKNGWTKFVSMQGMYSLLYREEEKEMNAFCDYTGVGLVPWGPLAAGNLARPASALGSTDRSKSKTMTQQDKGIVARVEEIAKKRGWTMSQVAIAWINKRVASPIIGFSTVERMEEALKINGQELTEEEEKYLEELYKPIAHVGHFD